MNLAEALNAALPDLPARSARAGYPRVDPALIAHENIEDGQPIVVAMIRGSDKIFRISIDQWRIIELFDGVRSYEEISELYAERYGVVHTAEAFQEFASGLDESGIWYKSAFEKNIALRQKLEEGRHQHGHRKSKWGDVAHMQFSAWDPDRYFNWLHPRMTWVYSQWFTLLTLALFSAMVYLFVSNWVQIGNDTLKFYTFTDKGASDLAEFWILFLILGFFHESAHGLTCKHYGAEVHRMGFHLIYLTPAFFVDVSEACVYASRWQRLVIIIAGIWVEMIFCAFATLVWWGTPSGTNVHELAYKVMLITGVAVVVVNMNPLIKLDGYYALAELIGFADIKEKSTRFLSSIARRHVFGLPVEVEYVPRRRRVWYVVYAVISGLYSYSLLFLVVRFSRNVFLNYSPSWAFVPALAFGYFVFRSRIRTLMRFARTVYLDKRDRVRAVFTTTRIAIAVAVVLVVLFAPIWRETVAAKFVLEPAQRAFVHAEVPGKVVAVLVQEGQTVQSGQPLLQMVDSRMESQRAEAQHRLAVTGLDQVQAELHNTSLAPALIERENAKAQAALSQDEGARLSPRAPIDGMVMTHGVRDLAGSYLDAGAAIAEIADTREMRVRMFILEYAVSEVPPNAEVRLLLDGRFHSKSCRIQEIKPAPSELAVGLASEQQLKGISQLRYYVADALIPNDGTLREGMSGEAKILVRHRSLAGFLSKEAWEFLGRKIW